MQHGDVGVTITGSTDRLPGFLPDFLVGDHRVEGHPRVRANIVWLGDNGARVLPTFRHGPGLWAATSLGPFVYERGARPRYTADDQLVTPIVYAGNLMGMLVLDVMGSTALPARPFFTPADNMCAHLLGTLVAYVQFAAWRVGRRTDASEHVGLALAEVRRRLNLTQVGLADKIGVTRTALSRWETGADPPSEGPLRKWCDALGLLALSQGAVVRVVEVTPAVLRMLKDNPDRLRDLSPDQFERLVAERLDRAGYRVTLAGPTSRKDGGIDLIAVPRAPSVAPFMLAAQVKHHSTDRKTGRDAVDRLLSWRQVFHVGLVVTNTDFTRDARWAATLDNNRWFIRLRNLDDLKKWLADNFWSEDYWREIPDHIDLAPGMRVRVPRPQVTSHEGLQAFREEDLKRIVDSHDQS